MAPNHPLWIRVLLRVASRRATDAQLGDVMEEYVAAGRSASWFVSQVFSIVRRRRSHSLIVEPAAALSLPVARRTVLRGAGIVMAAFGLVLLIAAANVANMLLARAAARTREVAIRLSVGATRSRLIQQLLTESAVIALGGALCGSLLSWWSFQLLIPWLLTSVPGAEAARIDVTPDRTVLWFALALTAATAADTVADRGGRRLHLESARRSARGGWRLRRRRLGREPPAP